MAVIRSSFNCWWSVKITFFKCAVIYLWTCSTDNGLMTWSTSNALDSLAGSDLIFVQPQLLFTLPEKQFDRPAFGIRIKNLLRRQGHVSGNKYPQRLWIPKAFLRVTQKNNCIWNLIEISFVTVNVKFPFVNGHKADIWIAFPHMKCKFAGFLTDAHGIKDTVGF